MDDWSRVSANRERSVDLDKAFATLATYGRRRGWDFQNSFAGVTVQTTSCQLSDQAGRSSIGRGKGVSRQTVASAMFEAVEHFSHKYEDAWAKRSSDTFSISLSWSESSPDLRLLFGEREEVSLSCLSYASLAGGERKLDVPIILTNPAFEPPGQSEKDLIAQTRIYRYGTNSGTASGLTQDEALLHGVLEVVERDALGMTFVHSILQPRPLQVRAIIRESIPGSLRTVIEEVESDEQATIKLWDVTSDLGIPVFLSSLTVGQHRFFGSGASLNTLYAAERAVLESLQGHHVHSVFGPKLQVPPNRMVERMSLYQRCGLDAGYFEVRGGELLVEFPEVEKWLLPVPAQLREVITRLERKEIECFWRSILDEDVKVTQVVSPRLERLYLICHGIAVAPSSRSRAAADRGTLPQQDRM